MKRSGGVSGVRSGLRSDWQSDKRSGGVSGVRSGLRSDWQSDQRSGGRSVMLSGSALCNHQYSRNSCSRHKKYSHIDNSRDSHSPGHSPVGGFC